jgi:hypothetical protein
MSTGRSLLPATTRLLEPRLPRALSVILRPRELETGLSISSPPTSSVSPVVSRLIDTQADDVERASFLAGLVLGIRLG